MNRISFSRTAIAVGVLGTLALAMAVTPAVASTTPVDSVTSTQVVKFGDLDLNHQGDAKVLLHRIRVAARQVCGINDYTAAQEICYERAIADAVEQVNRPELTAAAARASIHL